MTAEAAGFLLARRMPRRQALDTVAEALAQAGVDLLSEELAPPQPGRARVMAVLGKAGSGKTLLLAELTKALKAAGVETPGLAA